MTISPHSGQENLDASVPGAIILLHDVHMGMDMLPLSLNIYTSAEIA